MRQTSTNIMNGSTREIGKWEKKKNVYFSALWKLMIYFGIEALALIFNGTYLQSSLQ